MLSAHVLLNGLADRFASFVDSIWTAGGEPLESMMSRFHPQGQ
jgi:hypothetical protein